MKSYQLALVLVLLFFAGWQGHQLYFSNYSSSTFSGKVLQEKTEYNLIYQAPPENLDEPVLVRKVFLLQDRPDQIMLEVEYTYKGSIPDNQVKLFLSVGSQFTYLGSTDIVRGTHKRRLSIALDASDLKKADRYEFTTYEISMSFENYLPDKYLGTITRTLFPFEKHWQLIE